MKRTNFGFTLIELLVVIAIIAILAAILFPVFAKAREKARQTGCSSNEKQIALGVLQYTEDYDDVFPPGGELNATGTQSTWAGVILPYIKSTLVFICPDDAQTLPVYSSGTAWASPATSYMANGDEDWDASRSVNDCQGVMCVLNYISGRIVTQQSELTQPGTTILIAESEPSAFPNPTSFKSNEMYWNGESVIIGHNWGGTQYDRPDGTRTQTSNPNDPTGPNGAVTALHTNMANFAFCDGHVKAMPPYLTNPDPTNQPQNNMWIADR